jgi:hypothetical protein
MIPALLTITSSFWRRFRDAAFFLAIYGALDEIDRFGMQKRKLF